MTFREALDHGLQSIVTWLVVGVLGGALWLVRRVFTNQKQIELMQQALSDRDNQREVERAEVHRQLDDIKDSQREIKDDIKKLFQG